MKSPTQNHELTELAFRTGPRRGLRVVSVLLGISFVSGAVGWFAARQVRSPAEVAARTAGPRASRLTAPVEFRVLRSTLFTRGTVRFGSPRVVTLPGSSLKTGSLVVTAPPKRNALIGDGVKVADVGGRPVVVLQGGLPMYRDIRPGDQGNDVVELKAALRRLGFDPGSGDVFDGVAQRAAGKWMRSLGYEPFGATDTQRDLLRTATDALSKADTDIVSAQSALVKGVVAPSADKLLSADEAIKTAVDRADTARTDRDRAIAQAELAVTSRRTGLVSAQRAVDRIADDRTASALSQSLTVADAEQNVEAATQRVTDAEAAVVRAKRSVETAKADAGEAQAAVVDAQATLDAANTAQGAAQDDLAATKARPVPTVPAGDGVYKLDTDGYKASVKTAESIVTSAVAQVRSAAAGLRAAQRTATKALDAIGDAEAAVTTATSAVTAAREAARIADLRLTQAKTKGQQSNSGTPTSPTPSQASPASPTPQDTASPQAAPAASAPSGAPGPVGNTSPVGASSSGQGSGALDEAQLRAALDIAEQELDQALKAVDSAVKSGDVAVRAADAQVRIARAQRTELVKPPDSSSLSAAVTAARKAKANAEANVARIEATIGVFIPANEVLFFPKLPLRVDESKLAAGDALTGVFMTVATQRLAVDASVDPSDATALRVGQAAEVEASDLGLIVPGKITKIGATTGTDGAEASRIYVEVTPNEDTVPTATVDGGDGQKPDANRPITKPNLADLNGISVKVTVPISSTGGKVLAVPTPAVSAAADGTVRVEVETAPDRPTTFVTVKAGLRAEGYVQITPVTTGAVKEGDLVVTGTAGATTITGVPDAGDAPNPNPTDAPGATPKGAATT